MNEPNARDELFSACNELNSLWKQLEVKFTGIYMSFPTRVELQPVPTPLYLGWHKVKGEWRVCLGRQAETGGWDWKPILECPIEIRVEAVAHIRILEKELIRLRQEFLPRVREAVNSLREIVEYRE